MRRIALPLRRTIVRLRAELLRDRGETSLRGTSPASTADDPMLGLVVVAIHTALPSAVEAAQER